MVQCGLISTRLGVSHFCVALCCIPLLQGSGESKYKNHFLVCFGGAGEKGGLPTGELQGMCFGGA